ncbi:SurA N-terminal domain-containing protein [Paenibacillus sp. MZ04-78.2]|uniref:SurA N-terminal domain-containing protein n=1 Tax=Paenibacillus sp. MZ04-78.2 TaxID=2962034 RepID=UPI0020B7CF5C|nr:SurA N-terminal domain-containing protein [Paenibacillus sp. MZ04-78.2]MCP3776700.1 SurA N-terminal domain-containing protein [Paenibacillus sp. MZ04-78.2]
MINKLQNNKNALSSISDDALIDEMVKKELTVSHAKKLGIQVSAQEVDAVTQQERSLLNNPSITGEDNETVREIMKHRIRITGLSDEEFWKSNETRKEYEKALLMGKLFDKLVAEGKIEKDGASFGVFQNSLLVSSKGKVTVNKNALNN